MDKKTIFVITPIGEKGSEKYNKFDAIFNSMILPAVELANGEFEIIRADHIGKPGSFVRDILEKLQNSYIVIANLTDLNPNVFYELGVRHTLNNRTITITEDLSTLPADLREYRAIEYSPEITGIEEFKKKLSKSINEILANPDDPDNPVLDRLGNIIRNREQQLLKEIDILKKQPNKKVPHKLSQGELTQRTVNRILKIWDARRMDITSQSWMEAKKEYHLSQPEGNFDGYILKNAKGKEYFFVMSVHNTSFDIEIDLSDIRVMLSKYEPIGSAKFKFIIASSLDLSKEKPKAIKFFQKILKITKIPDERFSLEVWDNAEIKKIEKTLGLKM